MGSYIHGLFGANGNQTQQPAAALRVTTSLQGVPLPWLLGGQQRLPANLIWYGGFYSVPAGGSGGGGKGGMFSSSGGGSGYNYFASFMLAACEGPDISAIEAIWINGGSNSLAAVSWATEFLGTYSQGLWSYGEALYPAQMLYYRGICHVDFANYPLYNSPSLPNFGIEPLSTNSYVIPGIPDGDPSVCWTKFFTDTYRGLGFPAARMGSLTNWQQYCIATGLVVSPVIAASSAASSFIADLLKATNSQARWSAGLLTVIPYGDTAITQGQLTTIPETHLVPAVASGYSYSYIPVTFVNQFVSDGGVKYVGSGIPLVAVSGYPAVGQYSRGGITPGVFGAAGTFSPGTYIFNPSDVGANIQITYTYAAVASYVPNNTPVYSLGLDNFLENQGTIGSGSSAKNSPVLIVRKPRDQMLNVIRTTYLDRTNLYNPVTLEVKNEASIQAFGRWRADSAKQFDFLCTAAAAQQSAALMLQREQIARTFQWTSPKEFILLDVMDLVQVSDPAQGLVSQTVRITEIQENADSSLTFTAEEFNGTATAPLYNIQPNSGYNSNYNSDPGLANPPIIFEPPDELGGGLVVWGATSGSNPAQWGGCNIWVSTDGGNNYVKVGGPVIGNSRMGVTTADFPTFPVSPIGQTIDATSTLSVNLTESLGTLASTSNAGAQQLATASYVGPISGGGEIVSYATATLGTPNNYALTYLVRGAYGSEDEIGDHPSGSYFARLDSGIFKYAFDQGLIGTTIYIKIQGFNIYQGGTQNLAECVAYPYTITGAALASALPTIQNVRTYYDVNLGFTVIDWDDISDFRPFKYQIRSGASFSAAITLGEVAHPPFRVPGDGTFWLSGVSQPTSGLTVYSENWVDVAISGAVVTQNVMLSIDLKALGWPGNFTGGLGIDHSINAIRTGAIGNILTDTNILTTTDILNYGGGSTSAGYYYPTGVFLDLGYITNASVAIAYKPTGVPVGQNILTITNILTTPDILGAAATEYIDVYPIINTAASAGGDLYALSPSDLYSVQYPDLYAAAGPAWNGWQKFSPGSYQTRFLDFGMYMLSEDSQITAYDLAFKITVTIPARIDQYSLTTSNSGTTAIVFKPTGASATAPFNGGASVGNLPAIQATIRNAQAGDQFVSSGLTLSGVNVEVVNSGSPVQRTIDLVVQGY